MGKLSSQGILNNTLNQIHVLKKEDSGRSHNTQKLMKQNLNYKRQQYIPYVAKLSFSVSFTQEISSIGRVLDIHKVDNFIYCSNGFFAYFYFAEYRFTSIKYLIRCHHSSYDPSFIGTKLREKLKENIIRSSFRSTNDSLWYWDILACS